ncbi:histidine phosphatase family protein [Modestobacter sp. VKM Ac-2986]|uniref:histidine phosphatase family protein n=1 Tax=Modestobacter sp. VKM Ac-2986 TaxID=3004140 RepID=UPI0022AA2E1E|nr:histidine phosphatase family protein [Modestobacter sp. VKM Ac-2986]MCZ2827625.1 histidine phosphatase family protein [Modestobacter sp. VKM Ac-2986]
MARGPGPSALWVVRHGESTGNLADAQAHRSGAQRLTLDVRDPDVPLSPTGEEQADALGAWLARLPADQQPTTVLSSPFARAAATARRAVDASGLELTIRYDERLRERDFGAFDGMTRDGIRAQFPEEARRRDLLGKFYYRPPGGESWADVALRIRSLLATEALRHDGERLMCVSHQAVVMVFRYVLEELSEPQLLDVDRTEQVANTSVTRYESTDGGAFALAGFNGVEHLLDAGPGDGAPVTEENDVPSPA